MRISLSELRPLIAGVLAVLSLLATALVVIIGLLKQVDVQVAATMLGGFTSTFAAYALGLQSDIRELDTSA